MGKPNVNWEPDIKEAYKKPKNEGKGIDALSNERVGDVAKTIRKKKGRWKIIAILIILLLLFDAFFMNGEIFINFLKNIISR